ncbi:MAG: phosphodiester glycosidase family protein [Saprospiraceae bacterium]|nr:phosphodiester glycosidase family protein [Saprospiraceae bacterium]
MQGASSDSIMAYVVDPQEGNLRLYWKDETGKIFNDFQSLKDGLALENKDLQFAMNGGMFQKDFAPQGLYIEAGKTLQLLDTLQSGYGNFYLQPNGVFFLTNTGKAGVVSQKEFRNEEVTYATQSGPMLVVDDQIHPAFRAGSENVHIRNGVGMLADGRLLFAMSKEKINFFDFATFFKENGCSNALYLDGFVSKTYLPEQGFTDLDGAFGVIIAETKANKST